MHAGQAVSPQPSPGQLHNTHPHPPAGAVSQQAAILGEDEAVQRHGAVVAERVGVEKHLRLRIQRSLGVDDALRLQAGVVRVVVPAQRSIISVRLPTAGLRRIQPPTCPPT